MHASQFQIAERAHRLDIVERFLGARIRQIVPLLQAINAQHHGDRKRSTAARRLSSRDGGDGAVVGAGGGDRTATARISVPRHRGLEAGLPAKASGGGRAAELKVPVRLWYR